MTEQHKQHLYLVFDDWNSVYSIRKVSLSRRSRKRSEQSSDSGEDDSEQSGSSKGAKPKPLPVFMRFQAPRGFLHLFTSAFGTKIMLMLPDAGPLGHVSGGVPTIDVQDHTITFEAPPIIPACPIFIPVSDDRLFALDIGAFQILRKPEPGVLWVWGQVTHPPFTIGGVSSYGVQPDGCILVSTNGGITFIFDSKEHVWKLYGDWVFPFTGHGHYDPSVGGFVGLSKDPETLGYLYCCTMASTTTSLDTSKGRSHPSPDFNGTSKVKVYNKNPAEERHVSATLVHMRPGRFCLVECVCSDNEPIDLPLRFCRWGLT